MEKSGNDNDNDTNKSSTIGEGNLVNEIPGTKVSRQEMESSSPKFNLISAGIITVGLSILFITSAVINGLLNPESGDVFEYNYTKSWYGIIIYI